MELGLGLGLGLGLDGQPQTVLHVAGRHRGHRCVEVRDVRAREALLQPALHLLVEETALVRAHLGRMRG